MLGNVIMKEKPARKRARRTDWSFSPETLRMREVEKVIRARHHGPIPDPEDTDDRGTCIAYIRAAAMSLSGQDMNAWASIWAPWAGAEIVHPIIAETSSRRLMMRADGVAGLLGVTMAERTSLNLKTIGACDVSKAERMKIAKERKRERDRSRMADTRKSQGRKDRDTYEAESLSTLKPWEVGGVCRRTWERRRNSTSPVASPSRVESSSERRHTCDTETIFPEKGLSTDVKKQALQSTVGEAGRGRVRGIIPRRGYQGAEPHGSGDTPEAAA
ncbi:hypothetical protein [Mesorhizobium sp. LNJC405B00]|uniref:hypothetical protein n=1 Tax=Mesorhizobium sp. LNJC405B00 TaxID=1287281 RepID=UPI000A4A6EBC|nr:hypothetical protein [Mesorhizobium sp. LNJC405B00]